MPYIKTFHLLGDFLGEDIQYTMFKWFCAVYVWNYKLYKSVRTLFEKRIYQEPFDPHWINLLQMEYGSFGYKNVDTYDIFDTLKAETLSEYYDTYKTTQQQRQRENNFLYIPETLFIVKMGDRYICQSWNPEKIDVSSTNITEAETDIEPATEPTTEPTTEPATEPATDTINSNITLICEPSEIEFLYIEYNHPNMKESIELSIPESFYVCGNQLLSCAFVLRLLEKQPVAYIFDDKYFLNVLDQNIDRIQLTMHNYIELSKTTYKLKKNDFISRHLEHETLQKEIEESELTFFPVGYIQVVEFLQKFSGLFYFLLFVSSLLPQKKTIRRIINDEYVSDSEESEVDHESMPELNSTSDHDSDDEQKQESDDSSETQSFEIIDNKNI